MTQLVLSRIASLKILKRKITKIYFIKSHTIFCFLKHCDNVGFIVLLSNGLSSTNRASLVVLACCVRADEFSPGSDFISLVCGKVHLYLCLPKSTDNHAESHLPSQGHPPKSGFEASILSHPWAWFSSKVMAIFVNKMFYDYLLKKKPVLIVKFNL